jgi:membrane-bound lytic murein transglycosylase D
VATCEVCVPNEYVSRVHAEATPEPGGWRIKDLNSSNGLYWRGMRVQYVVVASSEVIRLGVEGPELSFQVQSRPRQAPAPLPDPGIASQSKKIEEDVRRYFRAPVEGEVVGEHTGIIRRAFVEIQTKQMEAHTRQKRVLLWVIGALALIGLGIGGYAFRLQREARHQRELAHDLFYAMKSLDVEIAAAEQVTLTADKTRGLAEVNKFETRRKQMQANYDQFLATLHIYDPKTTEQHRLIMRVARIFGECELDMPRDFESEVLRYIKYWQSTGRFARDIQLAKEKGYTRTIPEALLSRGLPVQFFYLAMQESDFDPYRSGPLTRKGYAKGMWQFIPETGLKYGLHLGPLVDLSRPDPGDQREQVDKATDAATRYIETLYSTDAQASGLLVMACYNWGEDQVLPLVRSMPLNPRQRNFWRLLADHRSQIPQETYDYVFYIMSAAVIGENPRLFGFDFDNPLD